MTARGGRRASVVAVALYAITLAAFWGCPGEKIATTGIVEYEEPIRGGISFQVLGTTDSTIDVVVGWAAPSSARPLAAYAVELVASINAAPPDSLVFADTVPATQLADSTTIRRTLPGDTLFVQAGVRAQNDRGTWGGLGQSPVIRIVIEDLGPGIPDVSIDTIPPAVTVSQVIVRYAGGLCLGFTCEVMMGDSVQACAILVLSDGTTGLASGSPAVCDEAYLRWLAERAA